jgi:branched-chain amino acid transport system substrate-binding protein
MPARPGFPRPRYPKPRYPRPKYFRVVVAALGALALLPLAACGNSGSDPSSSGSGRTYKVVLVSDLSGAFSSVSAPGAAGVEIAVDNINAHGGVNGKKIALQVVDSQSSPSMALAAAQKAVAEDPLALVMLSGSAGASSITSLVQSARVPLLSPAITDTLLYPARPYLYQPSLTAKQDAEAMFQFVKQKFHGALSGKVVDIAAINSPYVDAIIQRVSAMLKGAGATVANVERYDLPLASFATQAGAIARNKPSAVLELGSTDDTVVVSKALAAAGVKALEVGIPSGAAQVTLQQVDSPNYYALTANPYPTALPGLLAVAAKYGKKAEVSGSIFSMSGWVAAYMLADALKQCGDNCSAASLSSPLEKVSNLTVPDGAQYGPVSFSKSDHVAVGEVRFHNYDPATGKFSESSPIRVP